MEAIGCHETGCMNPFPNHPNPPCPPPNPNPTPQAPKSWQMDCLTGADCTSFHLLFFFSSPLVFNSFSIQRRLSSQRVSNAVPQKISWCWNWPETHPLSSGQKFSYMTNYCLHWLKSFVASLDDSGHNVEWLGGQLLTTWEKSKQCNLCENAPTSLKDLSSYVKRHRRAFPVGLLFLVRSTGDRLWTFEGGASLVSLSTWKETSSQTDSYTTTDWLLPPVFARDPLAAFPCLSSSVTDKNLPVCHSPDALDQLNRGKEGVLNDGERKDSSFRTVVFKMEPSTIE